MLSQNISIYFRIYYWQITLMAVGGWGRVACHTGLAAERLWAKPGLGKQRGNGECSGEIPERSWLCTARKEMRTFVTGRKETGQVALRFLWIGATLGSKDLPWAKLWGKQRGTLTVSALCDSGPLEERTFICPRSKWPGTMLRELACNLRNLGLSLGSSTSCVVLDMWLNCSVPLFLYLWNTGKFLSFS